MLGGIGFLVAVLGLACSGPVLARDLPCGKAAACGDWLALSTGGRLRYYGSLPLERSETVDRVVIVIHGNGRNADDYFEHAVAAARLDERLDTTLILAPNYRTRNDQPRTGEHYWGSGGWKIGDRSRDRLRVSSFAVMDELLRRVCPAQATPFPKLRVVTLAGHSAGAQFVNRYLAGGKGCPDPAVEVRFLVMNPSSYLYVDGRRRRPTSGPFVIPPTGCPGYDDYKYGLGNLNRYMRGVGPAEIRRRLFTRRSWYLAGQADTRAGRSLDQRCEAALQGEHRLARYLNYRDYARLFPGWNGAQHASVPGIGHSGREMLASEPARRVMFR